MAEINVLQRVCVHLAAELKTADTDIVRYRELAQLAIAQNAALVAENARLRRSREAEAEISGVYPR